MKDRARKRIAGFIKTNDKVSNPCGADPCCAAGWMGFPQGPAGLRAGR